MSCVNLDAPRTSVISYYVGWIGVSIADVLQGNPLLFPIWFVFLEKLRGIDRKMTSIWSPYIVILQPDQVNEDAGDIRT